MKPFGIPPVVNEMGKVMAESCKAMRAEISDVRYGPPGKIYFTFRGATYSVKEPMDVMPVGTGEASKAWALKCLLDKSARKIG